MRVSRGVSWSAKVVLERWPWQWVKNPPSNAGDMTDAGPIPDSGRSPGWGHGNPLQNSCLENLMGRGAWWATVHWVEKSWTPLKQLRMHARTEDQLNNRHCRQGKWKLEICHTKKNQTRNANLKYWCLEDFMTYWMWVKKKREVSSTFLAQASGWVASRINQNRDYRRRCIFWWQDAGGDDKMFILGQWIMRVEICIRRTIATSSQLKIQNWVSYRKTRW